MKTWKARYSMSKFSSVPFSCFHVLVKDIFMFLALVFSWHRQAYICHVTKLPLQSELNKMKTNVQYKVWTDKGRVCDVYTWQFLGAFEKIRKATVNFVMSVCLFAWNDSAPTGRIFMKFYFWVFFSDVLSRKSKFHENTTRITGAAHVHVCTLMNICRYF